ncbi:hypothetical protein CEXT_408251 [Caerostris extrusa]|uniref:Uncharacterized protein n=1 Tax=Caerostris extrusa TaxID=172846 RepID=A0AAV4RBA6_CAEEX|nr:hypothetical protein CEXT_408251 [Caerostris extrusa]
MFRSSGRSKKACWRSPIGEPNWRYFPKPGSGSEEQGENCVHELLYATHIAASHNGTHKPNRWATDEKKVHSTKCMQPTRVYSSPKPNSSRSFETVNSGGAQDRRYRLPSQVLHTSLGLYFCSVAWGQVS